MTEFIDEDDERFVKWIPIAVPLFAVVLLTCVFLIEATVL
jgi:hypothetical protein